MTHFLIAAAHKSSGKTTLSTGLAAAIGARGVKVQPFKKGPDYIDPMWLTLAAGRPCFNLDFHTMTEAEIRSIFLRRLANADVGLIEANKGLFDGIDVDGADSNAALAKLLASPVVLLVDTTGITRGVAPLLYGYERFDPEVRFAGIILNKVGGPRHESKLRAAIERYSDLPILGAVARDPVLDIGERHLGLTMPAEKSCAADRVAQMRRAVEDGVDIDRLLAIADRPRVAGPLPLAKPRRTAGRQVRIGIAMDAAFRFYYPDDLEAFAAAGADLIDIDTLTDPHLPDIDGLFIGGGFPECQMQALEANRSLRLDIKSAIEAGLPTYAECGGLAYLCKSLTWRDKTCDMVGVIDGDAVMHARPQGRGYVRFRSSVDDVAMASGANTDGSIAAHEFHYTSIEGLPTDTRFARSMKRGHGIDGAHDAIVAGNLVAGFCHLHDTEQCRWVDRFVDRVRRQQLSTINVRSASNG